MQRLKAAELVLAVTTPRLHAALRRLYDRLGPPLAAGVEHPLTADLAYLALKPAEWLATALARPLFPRFDALADRLYRDQDFSA